MTLGDRHLLRVLTNRVREATYHAIRAREQSLLLTAFAMTSECLYKIPSRVCGAIAQFEAVPHLCLPGTSRRVRGRCVRPQRQRANVPSDDRWRSPHNLARIARAIRRAALPNRPVAQRSTQHRVRDRSLSAHPIATIRERRVIGWHASPDPIPWQWRLPCAASCRLCS